MNHNKIIYIFVFTPMFYQTSDWVKNTTCSFLSELVSPEERSPFGPGSLGMSSGPEQPPEWMQRELLKQNPRRHSLHLGEQAQRSKALCHDANPKHTSHDLEVLCMEEVEFDVFDGIVLLSLLFFSLTCCIDYMPLCPLGAAREPG